MFLRTVNDSKRLFSRTTPLLLERDISCKLWGTKTAFSISSTVFTNWNKTMRVKSWPLFLLSVFNGILDHRGIKIESLPPWPSLQDSIVQSSDELHTPVHPFSHGLPGRTSLNTRKTQLNRLFKSSLTPLINSLIVQGKPPGPQKECKEK